MPTTITTNAIERSTYAITAAFTDETGAAVVPNSGLTWTLTDATGAVVNSREDVAIASAASVTVVLTNLDLAISTTYRDNRRLLTFEGTYNSSLGSNLAIRDQAEFQITDLGAVI